MILLVESPNRNLQKHIWSSGERLDLWVWRHFQIDEISVLELFGSTSGESDKRLEGSEPQVQEPQPSLLPVKSSLPPLLDPLDSSSLSHIIQLIHNLLHPGTPEVDRIFLPYIRQNSTLQGTETSPLYWLSK